MSKKLSEKIQALKYENAKMKAALDYICWLANEANPHLGHPRPSDDKCIFCNAYFAIPKHNGNFGYTTSEGHYKSLTEKHFKKGATNDHA